MNAQDRYNRVMELFDAVCDLDAAARATRLEALCAGDEALRREVESMLDHDGTTTGSSLIQAAEAGRGIDAMAATLFEDGDIPGHIGEYRILRQIGEGGMGIIYEAEQRSPSRRVALKVLRAAVLSPQVLRRFERESEVLGRLQHPGIAQVYEAGIHESARGRQPYFAMELIDGAPLDQHVRDHGLEVAGKLEIMARVCDAVHHAHQRGVIHRDLKPSNVLVARFDLGSTQATTTSTTTTRGTRQHDAVGWPKVLDFGIARVIDADVQAVTMQTHAGEVIGTLAYMSPEQLRGHSVDLDARCDVYALGVMLYELLVGERPFDLGGKPIAEAARIMCDEDPTLLSSHNKALRGDIETVVATALEKELNRRYSSAADLADELRRCVTHQPIVARPPTALYQLAKFARRNKGLVAGVVVGILSLVAGLVATALSLRQAHIDRDVAVAATAEVEAVSTFQHSILTNISVAQMGRALARRLGEELRPAAAKMAPPAEATLERLLKELNPTNLARHALEASVLDQAVAAADEKFADRPRTRARLLASLGEAYHAIGLYEAALQQTKRALVLRRDHGAPNDPATAHVCGNVAAMLIGLRRAAEAEPYCAEALARRQAEVPPVPQLVLEAKLRVAKVESATGHAEKAERLLRETLAGFRELGNPVDDMLLETLNMLGMHLGRTDRPAEALPLFEEAYAGRLARQEDQHPRALSALNNIASMMRRVGRLEEAEQSYRELLGIMEEQLGDADPRSLIVLRNLALVQGQREDVVAQRASLELLLKRQRRALGDDHEHTRKTVSLLAELDSTH
ncbi:MAG: serine/threonine-protein kinase [Planctomycetota bacterium]